ncbi:tetratricopeptide repeat protein [Aquimarina sp. TRL1]|uniref:tetratricopeptide repeat protein n=1 Tax=Aquimarina sp. (strain TRL1) TaxID=2736252 RepID=UPI00158DE7D7|nr:tetratricopeptide repeat protein [Aquimarina sp. TRL1]QKX06060.1 tetratricopeptide repeat protein [Aquimarina sp. TRL1]
MNSIKYIFITFVFFLFSEGIQAQNNKIDSLKNELEKHKTNDTIRVNLLYDLASSYLRKDVNSTKLYLEKAEKLSNALNYTKGKAKVAYLNGVVFSTRSKFDQAIKSFHEAILLYEIINLKEGLSKCYTGLGITAYYNHEYRKSIGYHQQSIQINKEIKNEKNIAVSLKYIAYAHSDMSNYDEALNCLNKALAINRKYNNEVEISSCLNNIGILYHEKGNNPLALEFYNKSLFIAKKIKDTSAISKALNNIGIIYKMNQQYEKAIQNYKESLKIEEKVGNKRYISNALNNLGIVYNRKGDSENALIFLNKALEISREILYKDQISTCLNNIGDVYLFLLKDNKKALKSYTEAKTINLEIEDNLGLCNSYLGIATVYANQKKYDKALSNVLKSKELSEQHDLLDFKKDAYELLSNIYKNTGNFKEAFFSHQKFKVISDSLLNKKGIERMTALEYEYKYKNELESAEKRELRLTKTVKKTSQDLAKSQRDLLLGIIAFLVIILLLGAIIFFLKLRNEKSKTQHIVIEQKLLRSQMTPHFIFNSLSVLQGMILNKEEKKSVSYLSKFSKLLRIILENSRDKTVLLSQELKAVRNYLALQTLESKSCKYTVFVEDAIDETLFRISPMLIQPFVENAIEHAFINQEEEKIIEIHLSYLNNDLICKISDNGVGIDSLKKKKNQEKKSLSTIITSERLEILSKDFKTRGSVVVEDRKKYNEKGTVVTLVIPYILQKN